MKDNLITVLALSPFFLGLYFLHSDLQLSTFCFSFCGFAMFCHLLSKQTHSLAGQVELVKESFKSHYVIGLIGVLAIGSTLLVTRAEILVVIFFISLQAFYFLCWAQIKSRIGGSYLQFILRVYNKDRFLAVFKALLILLALLMVVLEVIDMVMSLSPLDIRATLSTFTLFYALSLYEFEKVLKTE